MFAGGLSMDTILVVCQKDDVFGAVVFTLDKVAMEVSCFVDAASHFAFLVEIIDADDNGPAAG